MSICIKKNWKTVLWILFIVFLSFIKLPANASKTPVFTDKIVHLFLYFVLALIMRWEEKQRVFVFLVAIVLGGTIEILQGFLTTYRSADALDWLFDIIGALLGLYVYIVIKFLKRFSNKSNLFLL